MSHVTDTFPWIWGGHDKLNLIQMLILACGPYFFTKGRVPENSPRQAPPVLLAAQLRDSDSSSGWAHLLEAEPVRAFLRLSCTEAFGQATQGKSRPGTSVRIASLSGPVDEPRRPQQPIHPANDSPFVQVCRVFCFNPTRAQFCCHSLFEPALIPCPP